CAACVWKASPYMSSAMDRRLVLEFLPGIAFLAGNAYGGLLWAAAVTVVATAIAVALRWRWDGSIPWLAVATLVLAVVLTAFGLALNDETFVLVRPTVGAIAFAAILAVGAFAKPSLLQRTLGYRLQIEDNGWPVLHLAWIGISLFSAFANEVARQFLSTDQWAFYNVASDPILFGLIYLATRMIAEHYWIED
ncbi:MAG: septation protein IspZ, partial [Pseudomonadota bacterium]